MRRLVVDDAVYVWSVRHVHGAEGSGCREVFTAYLEGKSAAPLRITFADGVDRHAGYPARGVVWTATGEANLNTPSIARELVTRARARGWQPETARTPYVIADGFALLALA